MGSVDANIAVYDKLHAELESKYMGQWVLIHNEALINVYDSFEAAAADAVKQFGRGPYLIRQVGAKPMVLPASVAFFPLQHA